MPDQAHLDVRARLQLPPFPESAQAARRFVADFCQAAGLTPEVCANAALLVSELVTNAVVHGGSSATLEMHRPADTLRVSVRDNNPVLPRVGKSPELTAESGRGLHIVAMLATAWGIEQVDGGKVIWFELDDRRFD